MWAAGTRDGQIEASCVLFRAWSLGKIECCSRGDSLSSSGGGEGPKKLLRGSILALLVTVSATPAPGIMLLRGSILALLVTVSATSPAASPSAPPPCSRDTDCNSNGVCTSDGVCDCDAAWKGPDCYVIEQKSAIKLPLHIIAFMGLFVSVVCGFFILYRGKQMGLEKLKSSPAKRLPMYIAIGDIVFSATHWFDHLAVMIEDHVPSEPGCSLFAWFTYLGIMVSVAGAGFLSAFACYRLLIAPTATVSMGKFDCLPIFCIYGIPLLFTGLTYNDGAMGPGTSW